MVGRFAWGERNDNGGRLMGFARGRGLVVGNSLFRHKGTHVKTWRAPGKVRGATAQLDYVLVPWRWRSAMRDARAWWGVDVGSDHAVVVARMRLRLKVGKTGGRCRKGVSVDASGLRKGVGLPEFVMEVRGRFGGRPGDDGESIEGLWKFGKGALMGAAEAVLPKWVIRAEVWS